MPYLIDGHNLIPKIPGLSLDRIDDEYELIELLQEFCHRQNREATVFFDQASPGSSGAKNFGPVTARFVRQSSTADQAIVAFLSRSGKSARQWIVVSSDRFVQSSARAVHATVISSEEFSRQLFSKMHPDRYSKNQAETTLSNHELEEWLKLFGDK
jgi:predicted RNA-binding protein with PIN domain